MSRDVSPSSDKVIAVIGATGQQGGAVVRALQAGGEFKVRALSRNPGEHRDLADEVVEADLDRPETLQAGFAGAYGVFLVTNYWEGSTNELKQVTAAVRAAKDAGVKHFIWSTLPDVEAISGGKFDARHFTGKAKIDRLHMGDINELGNIVAGAFAHPDQAGNGEYLPLVGDFMSFKNIVDTLNR